MTSMRTRVLAALLAAVPAAGLLIGAAPAQAAVDVKVKSVAVSKSLVVLGSKAGCTNVTVTAALSAPMPTDGYKFSGVGTNVYGPDGEIVDGVEFKRIGSSASYRGAVRLCGSYAAGSYRFVVYGAALPTGDGGYEFTNDVTRRVSLKRPSKLTLNASPEPVVKGKKLNAKGTLKVDGKARAGLKVKIYFKPAGSAAFVYRGVATTNAKGVYSKNFKATKTGTWKAVYDGSGTRNAATAGDAVKVK
jgi:hypothetical protein